MSSHSRRAHEKFSVPDVEGEPYATDSRLFEAQRQPEYRDRDAGGTAAEGRRRRRARHRAARRSSGR